MNLKQIVEDIEEMRARIIILEQKLAALTAAKE